LFDTNNLFNLIANKEVIWLSNCNTEQFLHVLQILHVGRYEAECLKRSQWVNDKYSTSTHEFWPCWLRLSKYILHCTFRSVICKQITNLSSFSSDKQFNYNVPHITDNNSTWHTPVRGINIG
jgi:hypothetical protein